MALKTRQTDAIRSNTGASRTTARPKPKTANQASSSPHPSKVLQPSAKSKQAAVVSLLLRPEGATIAAMMETTGWKSHSVRGFLTGVVRKKLNLKLESTKTDKNRIYRIKGGSPRKTASLRKAKPRAA